MDKDFKPVKSVYNSNFDTIKNIMFLYGPQNMNGIQRLSKTAMPLLI